VVALIKFEFRFTKNTGSPPVGKLFAGKKRRLTVPDAALCMNMRLTAGFAEL
jgi:hypothetical protein